jgi:hypothetical protein
VDDIPKIVKVGCHFGFGGGDGGDEGAEGVFELDTESNS